jgi:hypothetical protein
LRAGKWTQLQIIFEAVDRDEKYPLGVKLTYRAFCQDEVKLLKRVDNNIEAEQRAEVTGRESLYHRAMDNVDDEIVGAIKSGKFTGIIYDRDDVAEDVEQNFLGDTIRSGNKQPTTSVGFEPATAISRTYDSFDQGG